MDMFAALLQIKNYKLFVANMFLLGMGIAVTVPYLVLFATKDLGMTTNQYGLLLASAAISQFTVNSIIARFSDTHHFNRKIIIILALLMGALGFSIYFFVDTIWLFILLYAIFQGLFAPAMPQLYASARESINVSSSKDRAQFANTVLRSMFSLGFLFGPFIGAQLIGLKGYAGLFGGTISIILFTLVLQVFFYKDLNIKHPISTQQHVEKIAPNMFKDKTLLLPFIAFILLHIGQWMYTMNMPLFVTDYLKENEQHVGYLASLCAGLEVPFMIILGVLSSRLQTRTLLIYGAIFGGLFYFSIGVFKNFYMMLAGQVFLAIFLAVLLGIGISYFQDILPDFPGYASTLFSNAMVIGQLGGNLLGGAMSHWVGLENVFFVSSASIMLAFVGLIKPIIPSVLVLWIGFLIYQFGFHNQHLSWVFYVSMALLTILILCADFLANKYFVNRFGGSKFGEYAALIGVVIGCFVLPPFGIIIIPFILVFIVELIQGYSFERAVKVSIGSIVAFLTSSIAQAIIMFIMIVWFFIDALLIN
ncbi:TPA: MFS transporter [Staphylococcus aureus]|nr:MFS transporter [Staphylococcus aureus]HDG0904079.1 MFS transporter [Staphylococcus aureus]